jgi:hypothetical protein
VSSCSLTRVLGPGVTAPGPTYPAETFAQYVRETRQPGYGDRLRATSPG